jgi:phytoene synthase
MAVQGRSFWLASKLLPSGLRDEAAIVYAFCRAADDAADELTDTRRAHETLDALERGLAADGPAPARAMRELFARRGLGLDPARLLLSGVRRDLGSVRIEDDQELLHYAWLVAGTVGQMMAELLGARDPRARFYAVQLGIAMQITNVCRDVAEDLARGRVYLPERRLRAAGTSQRALLAGCAPRDAVAAVVRDLLVLADRLYASADRGMRFLPTRARLCVLVASRVYRAIGLRLRARGCDALRGRVVVSLPVKLGWVVAAIVAWITLALRSAAGLDGRHAGA